MSLQTDTYLRLFDRPSPIAQETVKAKPVTALLVGGIVNPAGPTLNVVMAHGMWKPSATLPVVRVMLNPFSQEVESGGDFCRRNMASLRHNLAIVRTVFR
jgi:hypothetical protein